MPSPAIWWVGVRVIELPSNRMSPSWYWYSRLMQLNKVVLPAPLGPISPQTWPRCTSKVTPSSATMPPKRTVTPRTLSKVCESSAMSVQFPAIDLLMPACEGLCGRDRVIGCNTRSWQ